MDTIQIHPPVYSKAAIEEAFIQGRVVGYNEGYEAGDKKGFDRAVLITFWFFYKLFNPK